MLADVKQHALKRLNYLSGHLDGVRKMVEADVYCVDVLKQTHAVRRAIEKLEVILLNGHLRSCIPEGIKGEREVEVIGELIELYEVSKR